MLGSRKRPTAILLALLLAVLLAACGDDPTATPTPTQPPEELRDATVDLLRGLDSVAFEVTHPGEGTDMGGIILTTVEGVASFPDRAEMTARGNAGGTVLEFGIVQIADDTYFRDPVTRVWRTVGPGTVPFSFVGMNESVADALAATTSLEVEDGERIDGTETHMLSGALPSESLRGLVPEAVEGQTLHLTAWLSREDGLPLRVNLAGPLIDGDPDDIVRQLDLSDFNEPVTIQPPI